VHGFEQRPGHGIREARAQARTRLAAELEPMGRLSSLHQVHGAVVQQAPWEGTPAGDAGVAFDSGHILCIETADCLPVLVVDPVRRWVAAAHAGWRGTLARVVAHTVAALAARGSSPPDLLAVLGPAIGACCYEVGEDLRAAFGLESARFFTSGPRGQPHLNVRAANEAQLLESGLRPQHVQHIEHCTYCQPASYHSYRRDGPDAGRMLSFVGFQKA
jgi:polyphenol oxidase